MVRKERWDEVRRMRYEERRSVSAIARRLDLDRKTVRRCLRQEDWQPYQRPAKDDTLLAAHAEFLRSRAPDVCYSARILYQELTRARGYRGSYQTVKRFVAPLRALCRRRPKPRGSASRPHPVSRARLTGAKRGCRFAPGCGRFTSSC